MRTCLRWPCWASVLAGMLAAAAGVGAADGPTRTAADEIRREALRESQDAEGWPLPLAASWNRGLARTRGTAQAGFDPDYQLRLIEQGHRLLPWFYLGAPGERVGEEELAYYETALKRAAQLQLPITFVSTQWESLLTSDRKYRDVAPDQDPKILDADGKTIRPGVDAFGPWRDAVERGDPRGRAVVGAMLNWPPSEVVFGSSIGPSVMPLPACPPLGALEATLDDGGHEFGPAAGGVGRLTIKQHLGRLPRSRRAFELPQEGPRCFGADAVARLEDQFPEQFHDGIQILRSMARIAPQRAFDGRTNDLPVQR